MSVPTIIIGLAWCLATVTHESPTPQPKLGVNVLTVNIPGAVQPHLTIDASKNVHLVCGVAESGALYYTSSKDGGVSFSTPTVVARVPELILGMRAGPRIAATKKALIVTAGGGASKDFMAWRSTDGGKTWGQPTSLNTVKASGNEGLHDLASHEEAAIAVWIDMRNDIASLYAARSTDNGQTWIEQQVYQSPSGHICECCHPSVTYAPDGTIFILWRNYLKGMRDMFLISSKDGGKTWGEPVKLGEESWPLEACPMAGGAIAAFADKPPTTIWKRENTLYFSEPGKPEMTLDEGSDPWITPGPNGWLAVWKDANGHITMRSTKDERSTVLAELGGYPIVAGKPEGPVVAAWETEEGIFTVRLDKLKK